MSASLDVSAQVPGEPRPRIARLASGDIIQVVAELSDLLDAGCPLSRALGVVLRQAKKPPVQRLVEGLRDDIVNGSSLADALGNAGGHFSPVQVAMVRAAEAGGFLQQTLAHMSTFGRRRLVLIGKM